MQYGDCICRGKGRRLMRCARSGDSYPTPRASLLLWPRQTSRSASRVEARGLLRTEGLRCKDPGLCERRRATRTCHGGGLHGEVSTITGSTGSPVPVLAEDRCIDQSRFLGGQSVHWRRARRFPRLGPLCARTSFGDYLTPVDRRESVGTRRGGSCTRNAAESRTGGLCVIDRAPAAIRCSSARGSE